MCDDEKSNSVILWLTLVNTQSFSWRVRQTEIVVKRTVGITDNSDADMLVYTIAVTITVAVAELLLLLFLFLLLSYCCCCCCNVTPLDSHS